MKFSSICFLILSSLHCLQLSINNFGLARYEETSKSNELESNIRLEAFKEAIKPFRYENPNQIVTLGSNCLTKFRALSFIRKNPRILGCNHLFDYMVPLDYSLLAEAIANNFTDAFKKDLLTVTHDYWNSGGSVIHHTKYKFQFNHAFDGHDEVNHFGFINRLDEALLQKYFYLIEAKFDHLVENSQKAFTNLNRPLYVIYASKTHADPKKQRQEDFLEVLSAIKSLRDNKFLLLVLVGRDLASENSYNFDVLIDGNLCFHMIESYNNDDWHIRKSVKQWDELFEEIFKKQ